MDEDTDTLEEQIKDAIDLAGCELNRNVREFDGLVYIPFRCVPMANIKDKLEDIYFSYQTLKAMGKLKS